MSDAATPRPHTAFSASTDPAFDHESLRDLLVHPETPVEVGGSESRPRFAFARVGLVVATISGLCLVPAAVSLADGASESPSTPPACEISGVSLEPSTDDDCVDNTDTTPPQSLTGGDEQSDGAQASGPPPPPAPPPPSPSPPPAAVEPAAPAETPAPAALAAAPAPSHAPAQADAPAATKTPPTPSSVAKHDAPEAAAKRRIGTASRQEWTAGKPDTQRRAHRTSSEKPRRTTRLRHRTAPRVAPAAPVPGESRLTPGVSQAPGGDTFFVTDEPVIPRFLIQLYKQAGQKYRIPWPILAAINEIETDFGRNVAVSSAGAVGWMQFMPATWRSYGVDADHDGVKDPDNPRDAIFAAARYLRAGGALRNMRRAIFAYNHAGWYVDSVLLRAERIAEFQGARSRTLKRLFRAGERHLVRQVLTDDRITIYECGREDIAAGRIDRRVLVVLRFLAWSGLDPTVSSLECGHGTYTTSGNVSAHSYGAAVDIASINGIPIVGNQGPGSVTDATIRELLTLRGAMKPAQIISLMTFDGADNTLAMADHADHIHVGFRALPDVPR